MPFVKDFPAEQLRLLAGLFLSSNSTSTAEAVEAALDVLSYFAGVYLKGPTPPVTSAHTYKLPSGGPLALAQMTDADKAALLNAAAESHTEDATGRYAFPAVPWSLVIELVLSLLKQLLLEKKS